MRQALRSRQLDSWEALHAHYHRIHARYPAHNAAYAYASLLELHGLAAGAVDETRWREWREEAVRLAHAMALRTRESREKDYRNPYRQLTFDTETEMEAVMGRIEDNDFIRQMERAAEDFAEKVHNGTVES